MKRLSGPWNVENIKVVRRVIVTAVGVIILLLGVALLILPGPVFIVIPIGLAILATEYAWARRWLEKARKVAGGVISSEKEQSTTARLLALGLTCIDKD